jgi:hypothetical protein
MDLSSPSISDSPGQKFGGGYAMPGLPYTDQMTFGAYPDTLNSYSYAGYNYTGMESYRPMSVNKSRPTPYGKGTDYPTYISRMAGLASSGLTSSGLTPSRTNGISYESHYGTG